LPNAPKRFQPAGKQAKPSKPWQSSKGDLRKGFRGAKRQEAKKRILERDGYVCQICGCLLEGMRDSILDHVIPLSQGGSHEDDNLQSTCIACSAQKSAKESRDGRKN
jgi:5-methylcytosine-specific restriction protein A